MEKILYVENIMKSFNGNDVLKGVGLSLEKGEIYVLLGKNGAGKSTIFKILTGLMSATNGDIKFCDRNIKDYKDNYYREIGFNINEPKFYEHLNGRENLEIYCDYMNCSYENINYWLHRVGLSLDNRNPVRNYSMGMRQRLVLARTLVHSPKMIIIDEPLNGLDPNGIREFRELFKEISNNGTTILMSSHILSEVEKIADRIGVICNGNLVLESDLTELKESHRDNFEDFIIDRMEGRI